MSTKPKQLQLHFEINLQTIEWAQQYGLPGLKKWLQSKLLKPSK